MRDYNNIKSKKGTLTIFLFVFIVILVSLVIYVLFRSVDSAGSKLCQLQLGNPPHLVSDIPSYNKNMSDCLMNFAIKHKDVKSCKDIDYGNLRYQCEGRVTKDSPYCVKKYIQDQDSLWACLMGVGIEINSLEPCYDELLNQSYQLLCVYFLVISTGSYHFCDSFAELSGLSIQNESKDFCLNEALHYFPNIKICSNFTNHTLSEKCYDQFR